MLCRSCEKSERRGAHRAHECEGDIIGPTTAVCCGCPCQAVSANFVPPPMMAMDLA